MACYDGPMAKRDRRVRPATHPEIAPPQKEGEITFGLRAGLAVHAARPQDILRVAYAPAVSEEVASLAAWARKQGVSIEERGDGELARISGSTHHEGLCVLAKPRRFSPASELGKALVARNGACVALDRVRNPYNVGAILRTAAFFGVDAVLLGAAAPHPALAPDAIRVAEGGVEHLALARTTDLADTLGRLRALGVQVVGADGAATASVIGFAFARPTVLVFGHEREGLGARVRAQCDHVLALHGSGAVESLNVAVAAGLFIGELARGTR